jgi:YHS domain-containing protein
LYKVRGNLLSPLRIIILIILFYIAYRLIIGGRKKSSAKISSEKQSGNGPATDTLEEDPVCHKLVPRQQAISYAVDDQQFYFCSEKCCSEFKKREGEQK